MSEEIKVGEQKAPEESSAESATLPPKDDIAERVKNFNTDLKVILGKYELALAAEAVIKDGKVLAEPKVVDARTLPQK